MRLTKRFKMDSEPHHFLCDGTSPSSHQSPTSEDEGRRHPLKIFHQLGLLRFREQGFELQSAGYCISC